MSETLAPRGPGTLWRPVGLAELQLIEDSGFRRFPPRLPQQPIFYPVTTREYASRIAREWNTKEPSGAGFVTRFRIDAAYIAGFEKHLAGGRACEEYWIPAEELDRFNDHIVGLIECVGSFWAMPDGGVREERFRD